MKEILALIETKSTRRLNFCRTSYRIAVLFHVAINLKFSRVSRTLFPLTVFLVRDYDKEYFKFVFLVLNVSNNL